jgi:hypothetical protein
MQEAAFSCFSFLAICAANTSHSCASGSGRLIVSFKVFSSRAVSDTSRSSVLFFLGHGVEVGKLVAGRFMSLTFSGASTFVSGTMSDLLTLLPV